MQEFIKRRTELIDYYVGEGLIRRDAIAAGWRRAEFEFPPEEGQPVDPRDVPGPDYVEPPLPASLGGPEPLEPDLDMPDEPPEPAPKPKKGKKSDNPIDTPAPERGPRKTVDEAVIAKLVQAVGIKEGTQDHTVRWVQNRIKTDWADIDKDDVPCQFAITLLQHAKSTGGFDAFMRDWAPKLMPTKSQIDNAATHRDDNRSVFELLSAHETMDMPDDQFEILQQQEEVA